MTNGVALLCHPYHRGGVTQWMIQAGAEWRRRGHQVWFVTVRPKGQFRSGGNRPAMADLLDQLPTPERPAIAARDAGSEFEYGTEAYRAGVYAQLLRASVPAGIPVIVSDDRAVWRGGAALATRNPLIGVLHSDDAPYYELARRYGHVTATLVCVSRRVESEARRQVPSLSDRLAVIPCGIPMSRPNHRSAPLTDRLRLIWAGRIEQHQKRVLDIPRIAAGLRAQGLPFHWDIIGDGPERQALQDAVKASGLDDHVRMLGWRPSEEVRELAARADVLVLPSNFEGMPMVLMEVMAEGCAAVASRVSGVEDYESHA
ncbi:MAG: glycosyltransferase, partial [Gemmatimonadaceae bacterium]